MEAARRHAAETDGIDAAKSFGFTVHSVRCDATNSSVVHSCKAHVLEVRTTFKHGQMGDDAPIPPDSASFCIFADIAPLPAKCGGAQIHAVIAKQLRSTGIKTWEPTQDLWVAPAVA